MNSASQGLAHQADGFALEVFSGRSPRLTPTRNVAFVPRDVLEQPYEGYSLLETTHTGVYWILKNGQRLNNRCYCQVCRTSFNGSGSNIKAHIAKHQGSKQYSDDQKMCAAFLFLIKHSIGFTTFRDPLVKIFLPQMSSSVIEQLLVRGCTGVHAMIQKELENRDVTVMIDGWCDASLRRFLGVALAYYNETRNTIVHRLLDLGHGIAGRHTAAQLTTFLRNCLADFGVQPQQVVCLCSDSASVNPAVAENLSTNWMPCCVHLWNLVVQNFVANSPEQFRDVLGKINNLRKKTLWIEYVGRMGHKKRNITGFCPTRWCSVCACIDSFLDFRETIMAFQAEQMKTNPLFSEADFEATSSVNNLLQRFSEANDLLLQADQNDGLASVYEAINAVYLVICHLCDREWDFSHAVAMAKLEVEVRFFNIDSKFCCRVMFAGLLNVRHTLPSWLEEKCDVLAPLLCYEVELTAGDYSLEQERHENDERYSDERPLLEIIEDSPASYQNTEILDEISNFFHFRKKYHGTTFSLFWSNCDRFANLAKYAAFLRRMPTTTVWLERAFSIARRNLSWTRLRLSPEKATKICFLALNFNQAMSALGLSAEDMSDEIPAEMLEQVADDESDDFALDEEQ